MSASNDDITRPGLTIMVNFGHWGGIYISLGGWTDIRICLGFMAINILRQDIDGILEEYCDLKEKEVADGSSEA